MTVRGRKGFVEAYRAFKKNSCRTDATPGRVRVEKKDGGSGVQVDGDRLVATRSVKVRVHPQPKTGQISGLLRLLRLGACSLSSG